MAKLCIFCKHFNLDMGYPDPSEVTPGLPPDIWCGERHWDLGYNDYEDTFRAKMLIAIRCPDYEYIPIEEI